MESIDKLREKSLEFAPNIRRNVNIALNEIETEIERDYMLLPVDADGVPIQIGDLLESSEINKQFMCRGMSLALQSNEKRWTVEWSYDHYYGTSEYVSAKSCRHVKPRTLESILCDALADVSCMGDGIVRTFKPDDLYVAELAAEIRELMGGDAE